MDPLPSDLKRQTHTSAKKRHQRAFSLIELIIVVSVLSIVAIISIPNYVRSRDASTKSTCTRNLTVIDHAVQEWAFDQNKTTADTYSLTDPSLLSHFRSSRLPVCPGNGTYTAGNSLAEQVTCNIPGHTL